MAKAQTRLTEEQKSAIYHYHRRHPKDSYRRLGQWAQNEFKLVTPPDRSTIGRIIKDPERFDSLQPHNHYLRRAGALQYLELEEVMATWVSQMEHRKISVADDLLQEKARAFAKSMNIPADQFEGSIEWLHNFKKRHSFKLFRIHGESGSAKMEGIEEHMEKLRARIACYNHDDIYNMDEMGLFYNMAPDTTIASRQIAGKNPRKEGCQLML
jgi:Tc5 transposase DNA-binding domain